MTATEAAILLPRLCSALDTLKRLSPPGEGDVWLDGAEPPPPTNTELMEDAIGSIAMWVMEEAQKPAPPRTKEYKGMNGHPGAIEFIKD